MGAELDERGRLQTQEHQARLAQLASDTERILSMERKLAEFTLQHSQELERDTEQHAEELRELEDGVREKGWGGRATRLRQSHALSLLCCTNAFIKGINTFCDGEMVT